MKMLLFLTLLFTLLSTQIYGLSTEKSLFVFDPDQRHLDELSSSQRFIVDHVSDLGYELYTDESSLEILDELGVIYEQEPQRRALSYPSPSQIEKKLKELAKKYPKILKLTSLGKSHQGRDLWAMKLSDHVEKDEMEPEVKYIANMHGDEIVGRELMVYLIEDLASSYQRGDGDIRELLDHTEVFIMPSMNPDGAKRRRRGNAQNKDLNRDFPDFTTSDNVNESRGRQLETKAIMRWQAQREFALSANFHGGAVVVNYPWDTEKDDFPQLSLVKEISRDYAKYVKEMDNSGAFPGGIVNGYDWYEVDGGMQDWSYYWHNDLQVTVELSQMKWPNYSKVKYYYKENRRSLIEFLKQVHRGAGLYFNEPGRSGRVEITNLDTAKSYGSFFYGNSSFYKVLDSGTYQFDVFDTQDFFVQRFEVLVDEKIRKQSYLELN